jgi:hypothetical protein
MINAPSGMIESDIQKFLFLFDHRRSFVGKHSFTKQLNQPENKKISRASIGD